MAWSRSVWVAPVLLLVLATGHAVDAADLERGEALFDLCAQCHGSEGGGEQLFLAPPIAGLDEWYVAGQLRNFRSGSRGAHPGDVAGLRMYSMSLWLRTDEDLEAVAAYVAGLPPRWPEPVLRGGDAERGAWHYATCIACHGERGRGKQEIGSPPLVGSSDWYLFSSLERYRAGIRGASPQNASAMLMRGMSMQLPDEQAIKDVVAYIMALRDAE